MTAPRWVTPQGPILKPVATASGNAALNSSILYVDDTSGIKNDQVVMGLGINNNTEIKHIQDSTVSLPINSIRPSTANTSIAIITYPQQQHIPFSSGSTVTIKNVHTNANDSFEPKLYPNGVGYFNYANSYNTTYEVKTASPSGATLYASGSTLTGTATRYGITLTKTTEVSKDKFVLETLGNIKVGQYVRFQDLGIQTTIVNGQEVDYRPFGEVQYFKQYTVNSVDIPTRSITVIDSNGEIYPKAPITLGPFVPQMGVYAHDFRLIAANVTGNTHAITLSKQTKGYSVGKYKFYDQEFIEDDVIDIELRAEVGTSGSSTGTGSGIFAGGNLYQARDFVAGNQYKITTLGDTNWNTIAGTTGITYAVGDVLTAAADTGRVELPKTTGASTQTLIAGFQYRIDTLGSTNWNRICRTKNLTYAVGDLITPRVLANGTANRVTLDATQVATYDLVKGQLYKISSLGALTQTQWNFIARTTGVRYQVGDIILVQRPGAAHPNLAGKAKRIFRLSPSTYNVLEGEEYTYDFALGTEYYITFLGRLSQAEWNNIAGTTGVTYKVGDVIRAVNAGTPQSNIAGQAQLCIVSATATPITNLIADRTYRISSLGNMTQLQWNMLAGTTDVTYAKLDIFVVPSTYNPASLPLLIDDGTGTVTPCDVPATMIVGEEYRIEDLGNTDWAYVGYNTSLLDANRTYSTTQVGDIIRVENSVTTTGAVTRMFKPKQMDTTGSLVYKIAVVGNTDWNMVAGTSGLTYTVGTSIAAVYHQLTYGVGRLVSEPIPAYNIDLEKQYAIVTLGDTNWNLLCGTVGKTYYVGDIIKPVFFDPDNSTTTGTVAVIVPSEDFVLGYQYKITALGNTNWDLIANRTNGGFKVGDVITAIQHAKRIPIKYTLLNGNLPSGSIKLESTNNRLYLRGKLGKVSKRTVNTFTIRASIIDNGFPLHSDRTFSITVVGRTQPVFITKPGVLGNEYKLDETNAGITAPPISKIVVNGGNTFISVAPHNIISYGLTNNTVVYMGGVTSMPELNDKIWYVNNANVSTSMLQLYNAPGSNDYYQSFRTDGIYAAEGTISTITLDSNYFEAQLLADLPIHANTLTFSIVGGSLPPGLEMNADGFISGYPKPPLGRRGEPLQVTYSMSVRADTETGYTVGKFTIPVFNQELLWNMTSPGDPFPGRQPAILNNAHKTQQLDGTSVYYSYFFSGDHIGTFFEDSNFQFKILGYDWNKPDNEYNADEIIYNAYELSAGNVNEAPFSNIISPQYEIANGGWITGKLNNLSTANLKLKTHSFSTSIAVPSIDNQNVIYSKRQKWSMTITNSLTPTIKWVTPENMGSVLAGEASRLSIIANFSENIDDGKYRLLSGNLPPHLELLSNGDIVGKIVFQPTTEVLPAGDEIFYHFTVEAYSEKYANDGVRITRKFTLGVKTDTDKPYDTLYVRALLPPTQRYQIQEMLNSIGVTNGNDIYRPQDINFGISHELKYVHAYGVESQNADDFYTTYAQVIKKNHYFKNLVLGDLKTAVARDSSGNIIYEVVYAPIVDSMMTAGGSSVSKSVAWPNPIVRNNTQLSQQVYPNSLVNMRLEMEKYVGPVNATKRLPLWMTSQQRNGSDSGYISVWVLCYTLPDKSEAVKTSINKYLTERKLKMNNFNFSMDRFEVDRTMSYTWGVTAMDQWPSVSANFYADTANYGDNIVVNTLIGLEINQPIKFSNGANLANIKTDNTYFVTEINPRFVTPDGSTSPTIKIRADYYGDNTTIITPGEDGNMTIKMVPLSAFASADTYDTYVIFEQETILTK